MRDSVRSLLLSAVMVSLLASAAFAADWHRWRGPRGDGTTDEPSRHATGWPPARLWARDVGPGCTSPLLAGGRLYVMGFAGRADRRRNPAGPDVLYCFDAATGEELWRQTRAGRYQGRLRTGDTGAYGGPSATPTLDPGTGLLYTQGVDGDLRCWDTAAEGKLVWEINFHERFTIRQRRDVGRGRRDYGHTCSPYILGRLVLAEVGAEEGTVMAFDKRTGKQVWASEHRGPGGHSGGLTPLRVGGVDAFAELRIDGLVVFRAGPDSAGKTLATWPRKTDFACNIPTPAAVDDGSVLLTSEYNQSNTERLAVAPGKARRLWRSRAHTLVSTPVVAGGRVFLLNKVLRCLKLADGQSVWRGGNFGHGSMILTGDGKLMAFGNGRLALLDPFADNYTELSRVEGLVKGTCYPHLAFANGLICCKDRNGAMVVLSVRPEHRSASITRHETRPPTPAETPSPSPAAAGEAAKAATLHDAAAPKLASAWPGSRDGLLFAWQDARASRGVKLSPRGDAELAGDGRMHLADGAMLADKPVNARLLAACRKSNQLAVEALLDPADLRQSGPARIVSFSTDGHHRNFTLGQERDRLVFRLRTPATGLSGQRPEVTLCKLPDAGPVHVIVSYSPGRMTCYVDGKRVLDTDAVTGDFSNWTPQHLLFGDEYRDRRDWSGEMSHVAVWDRVVGAAEAAARFRLAGGNR